VAQTILAIVGETGSGKSSLAMRLAKEFDGEIICGDAWTLRKRMDIGTAKPTLSDRAIIKHHLIDIVEPDASFSAAKFQELANQALKDIEERGRLAIIVGGSGLYIDSVLYDYSFTRTKSDTSREELNKISEDNLIKLIHNNGIELGNVDTKNKRRLIRLLESNGESPKKHKLRQNTLIIGLRTEPEIIRSNLIDRLDTMIKLGLENEVRGLSDRYGWDTEALKGIGYKEWQDYFNGLINESELRDRIINNSLGLAKKQRTWFKRNTSINWINNPYNWNQVVDLTTTFIKSQV
jgi:tRNA dimethylallyltransferase